MSQATSWAQKALIGEKHAAHLQHINSLRACYMHDVERAKNCPTFQTITFDGSDTKTCAVPQRWRQKVHNESPDGAVLEQKIQTVLIHGKALNMYICTPYMRKGSAFTVSTLLDSLTYVDDAVECVRFQFDGMCETIACSV
jgi:hypothetical protein